MKFGEKVRDLRKKHSLTQDELAQCLGINKRTIIGWERDGRYPRSIEMLEKMADIFHVPLTYLQPDQSLFIERAAEAYGKKGKIEAQHIRSSAGLLFHIFCSPLLCACSTLNSHFLGTNSFMQSVPSNFNSWIFRSTPPA